MKLIELTQDRLAIVDDEDFDWLSKWNWHYWRGKKAKTGYAMRKTLGPKRKTVRMQVAVMKRHKRWKRGREVDHIDTCGCDNRKVNLRLASRNGQTANSGLRTDSTSGVRGVSWHKKAGKWEAYIHTNGKRKHLSLFDDFDEAVEARRRAEIKYFGEYRYDSTNVCPLGYTGQCPECAARLKELRCL